MVSATVPGQLHVWCGLVNQHTKYENTLPTYTQWIESSAVVAQISGRLMPAPSLVRCQRGEAGWMVLRQSRGLVT